MGRVVPLSILSATVLLFATVVDAAPIMYAAQLNGATETIPNASTATGAVSLTIDTSANTLSFGGSFSGLASGIIMAHIHCCTATSGIGGAGVATLNFVGPAITPGVTVGMFSTTLDLTSVASYNPTFLAAAGGTTLAAETLLATGLAADKAYVNLHTNAFPAGEIEGFLTPVPEPGTLALVALGLVGVTMARKRVTAVN